MLAIRRAADRGHTRTDWLDSAHTFSFGSYRDPAYTGFRDLRVLNDDRVAPGAGFAEHPPAAALEALSLRAQEPTELLCFDLA